MNAAIRSVVRTCVYKGITPMGFYKGYDGLINGKMIELNARSVKGIINKGGTILKTARSKDFRSKEGRDKAYKTLKSNNIERVERKGYFGRVHAIALDSLNNRWVGAADKDWEGSVSSFE